MEFLKFSYLAASMPDYWELSFKTSMLSLHNRTICSKILEQISDRITFTLKFTCIKWYATCCLWPDSHCVIDIIRSESGFLNFLHGKVPGKLMYNSGYHFQMTEFFCSYVVEQSRSRSVRHGKTLGKITQGSADLPVRATGVQYPIIVPQSQCLCGFAGFSILKKYYESVKMTEMALFYGWMKFRK